MRRPAAHRGGCGVLIAFCLSALSTGQGAVAQEEPSAVVVAGLRPTTGDYGDTDLRRLAQAQELRGIMDDLVHEVSRRPVLNHAALRAALGNEYLVDLFDCEGKVACVARLFARVRDRASLAVYGDYTVAKDHILVRLRLVDLAKGGGLLAEEEFSLTSEELTDRERWKEAVSRLMASVATAEPGTVDGGGEQGGTSGEGGGGSSQGGSASAAGTEEDDLSDADFGVQVSDTRVAPVERRGDIGWLLLTAHIDVSSRRFDFASAPGMEALRPGGFEGQWVMRPGATVELYPLARRQEGGLLNGLGLVGEYSQTVAPGGGSGLRDSRLHLGLAYRLALGASETLPVFQLTAGYLRQVETLDESSALPDVAYSAAAFGTDVHFPLGTPVLAIRGTAATSLSSGQAISRRTRTTAARAPPASSWSGRSSCVRSLTCSRAPALATRASCSTSTVTAR